MCVFASCSFCPASSTDPLHRWPRSISTTNCRRAAQRMCPQIADTNEFMIRKLYDAQLIMSVSGSLSVEGAVLNMNQVNVVFHI